MIVCMYSHRNIPISTDRKEKKTTGTITAKYTTTLGEGDKEGERGGWGGEIGMLVGVLLC